MYRMNIPNIKMEKIGLLFFEEIHDQKYFYWI